MSDTAPPDSDGRDRVEIRLSGEAQAVGSTLDPVFEHGEHLPDDFLVRRAQAGSTEAFEVLVAKYRAQMYRVALRLIGRHEAAEDVCQDAFVAAWRALPGFRGEASFSTWIHQIVLNGARTQLTRTRPTAPLPEEASADEGRQPEQVVQSEARDRALHEAVGNLPFDLRAPLVMVQFEGSSYEQAAEILGISVSTVRGRVYRARRALLDVMREWR